MEEKLQATLCMSSLNPCYSASVTIFTASYHALESSLPLSISPNCHKCQQSMVAGGEFAAWLFSLQARLLPQQNSDHSTCVL